MNETTCFLVQYRVNEHEKWTDDTCRFAPSAEPAKARAVKCRESKIFRGAQFRIIKRTDVEVV